MPAIILPEQVKARATHVCLCCGHPFFAGEERAWQEHVARCADDRLDEVYARAKRGRLFPDIGDADFEAWVRRNADDIIAGRLKM